jgi:hypothetical protein
LTRHGTARHGIISNVISLFFQYKLGHPDE